jgi:HD-GYP domain-containing protein (c-di-GMP phosphodiesterase class II)
MDHNHLPHPYRTATTQAGGLSTALDERDAPTQDHCDRVSGLSLQLGQACALSDRELKQLRLAAGLHDIGKIGIPDQVLKKPGLFNANDWTIMKTHPERGERIVLAAGLEEGPRIASVVRHHHERFDGAGYPDGLRGEAIPLFARIVALVDAYDAMAHLRPHSLRRAHAEIMRELLQEEAGQHDPYLIAKFAAFIERSQFRAET